MVSFTYKTAAIIAAAVIAVAAAAVYIAADSDDEDGGPGTITVTDVRGRSVAVPEDVDKVVTLSAGSARLVSYFGQDAVDKIVGIDSYDAKNKAFPANYYKATYRIAYDVESKTDVGSEESTKAIMETGADVIITSMTDVDNANTLQSTTGIAVVCVDADGSIDVNDDRFKKDVTLVGKVLGMESRASELISGIDQAVAELAGYNESSTASPNCYIGGMFYFMKGGLYETTGNYLPFDLVGAENAMPDSNSGNPYQTDKNAVMKAGESSGIDYIFIDAMTASDSKTTYQTDKTDLASTVSAAADGKIYSNLVYKYYGTNWEMELINAYYIGSVIDPTVFDYSVEDKVNEILALFFPDSDIDYSSVCEKQGMTLCQLDW